MGEKTKKLISFACFEIRWPKIVPNNIFGLRDSKHSGAGPSRSLKIAELNLPNNTLSIMF